ncbi:asparagine synthase-related protein [Planctomicrobium sp. SH527]|uniref:asparagine synthase-related protein n=1 Tax=Planctomicrobium sp. SH527 TaxID=3448123 RepID=UPI003F5C06B2
MKLAKSPAQASDYHNLTGVFVLGACSPREITLFTDRMGVYPVYQAPSKSGNQLVLGTHPEIVAELSGRKSDFDEISLAEILIKNTVTFPFTTRTGMEEFSPGSKIQIFKNNTNQTQIQTTQLWLPSEPKRWPSLQESVDQLESALRFVGEDLTRGSKKVAATLSGGADSRVVLSCIPADKRSVAITYGDHVNFENEIANSIATAVGVDHRLIIRQPEMYAEIPALEARLLGYERGPGHCHGYALKLSKTKVDFDLLLCGDRADTLVKGIYVPRRLFGFYHNKFNPIWCIKNWNSPINMTTKGISDVQKLIRPEIVEAIHQRVRSHLRFLKTFRARSAIEWFNFYPLSRHEHISYAHSCMRFFPHDVPFMHASVLDVAASAEPHRKYSRALTVRAFNRLAGSVNNIIDANDGLPSSSSPMRKRIRKSRKRLRQLFGRPEKSASSVQPGAFPWFTNDSWVDLRLLQKHSPIWQDYRKSGLNDNSLVSRLFRSPPSELIQKYDDGAPEWFQFNLTHLSNVNL